MISETIKKERHTSALRREKPPLERGAEATVDSVRAVFEQLVPDEATRHLCAEIFAETIEQVHAAGGARWQCSLRKDLVRLNGGRVLIFDIRRQDVFIGVDPSVLDAPSRALLEANGELRTAFSTLPHMQLYLVPHDKLRETWTVVKEAYRRYVAEAVLTARLCPWARAHVPAVVDYLSTLLNRKLPQPTYSGTDIESEPECRVYWVNQNSHFENEIANGYVFARKEDTNGSTPNHWRRLTDLVPGDLLVHYAGGAIRAISRVRESAVESRRSDDDDYIGWRANVEVFQLATPIDASKVLAPLKRELSGEHGPLDRNGKVKQGYLWNFSEAGLAAIRAASNEAWPAWANVTTARYWMFHANPDVYDVRAATKALDEMRWSVRQHKSEIRVGDTVFIWETGPDGGVVAVARVLTEPTEDDDEGDPSDDFWKAEVIKDDDGLSVRLRIERRLDPPVRAQEMRAEPLFADLPAFTSPQRTNSALSPAQGELLSRWAAGERPVRVVKIAPGPNAEHWNDCLDGGYICVGWDEVGDLKQFSDWSSFRKAFGAACELGKTVGHVTIKAQELWTLRWLRPGDKIIANRGLSRVLAIGTVREPGYQWRPDRPAWKHTVNVDWDTSVACDIPPITRWGLTTVGKVPPDVLARVAPELDANVTSELSRQTAPVPTITNPFVSLLRSLGTSGTKLWFPEEVVAHYVLALQAKRFVILSGVSGTGKTQLALAVAKHFQPRIKRTTREAAPANATTIRVQPSMLKYRRFVIPASLAAGLSLGGMTSTGTGSVEVEYPNGCAILSCYRYNRSSTASVHQLLLKQEFADWFRENLAPGDEFFLELLDPSPSGTDRLRLTVPKKKEELVVVKNYEVVAVRPDWTDGRGLLGFYNPLTERYVTTPFLRLLMDANEEMERATQEKRPPSPFFAILDEMNLARVEQYFSDFLSAMESGEEIALHEDARLEEGDVAGVDDEEIVAVPRRIRVPPNLFFTGTVNVDETTYMFSPKVLDRAFVIEFNDVNLEAYSTRENDDAAEGSALRLERWTGFDTWRPVSTEDWDALGRIDTGSIRADIVTLNELLARENRHFGYRVANEMARFLTLAARQCADPDEGVLDAFDLAIMSKVLPKLHGTQQELEDLLVRLFAFTVGRDAPASPEDWEPRGSELGPTSKTESSARPRLPRSSLKVWRMLRRLRAQGFTSFIE